MFFPLRLSNLQAKQWFWGLDKLSGQMKGGRAPAEGPKLTPDAYGLVLAISGAASRRGGKLVRRPEHRGDKHRPGSACQRSFFLLGSDITLDAGATVGLGHILFDVSATAPSQTVPVTFAAFPATSL